MTYNDNSVNENNHLSSAFSLMQQPDSDIFQNLSP